MTLQPGSRFGPYEITGSLGAGGMGEVYRARDTRLEREVAIKILPERWSLDDERRARFDREARVLASVNHPHIGAIYGIEESAGMRGLVLELIPGPTLADWLKDGALSQRDALRFAVQIASALEAAHERGIVHRDLKPANVILRGARQATAVRTQAGSTKRDSGPRGDVTVKVVDFGLAKELVAAEGGEAFGEAPTEAFAVATREGVLVGTVGYMSPEQARGERIDKRADLWAFGCVLFEMLTGRAPFEATSWPDTLAAIMTREPDWSALPNDAPFEVRRVLRRCLEKESHQRLRDAGDVRIALEDAAKDGESPAPVVAPQPTAKRGRSAALLGVAALAAGVVAGLLISHWAGGRRAESSPSAEMRLEITTPPTYDPVSLAISPDGKKLAFVATSEGRSMLWVRALDTIEARRLAGTENASLPFWSPDGRAIGFFTDRELRRIDVDVGAVQVIAPVSAGRGGSWGPDGTIVFQGSPSDRPMMRVPSTGGEPTRFGSPHSRFPHFLPDGHHVLYYDMGGAVYAAALDGSDPRRLLDADSAATFASGHLFFVRGTTLLAQRFDTATLALSGSAFPIAGNMSVSPVLRCAPLSATTSGPIVYRAGTMAGLRQFEWIDRDGHEIAKLGVPFAEARSPSLSPDENSVVFVDDAAGSRDIWQLDCQRGVTERMTTDPGAESQPIWSPDGARLIYVSSYSSTSGLLSLPIRGGAPEVLLHSSEQFPNIGAEDWSKDGRFVLFNGGAGQRRADDIWVLPLDPPGEPTPFAVTAFAEGDGQFSPDGDWIAYTSDESGQPEVYLGRFRGPQERIKISTNGGGMARWRRDGRELFYLAPDGRLMSVRVEPTSDDSLQVSAPVALFEARIGPPLQGNSSQQYMVAADGKRFLLNRIAEQNPPPITVLLNWQPAIH